MARRIDPLPKYQNEESAAREKSSDEMIDWSAARRSALYRPVRATDHAADRADIVARFKKYARSRRCDPHLRTSSREAMGVADLPKERRTTIFGSDRFWEGIGSQG